jgi:hypothetical protein
MSDIARQIADVDAQIASVETRIFEQKKRVENLRAKGSDPTEAQAVIATLGETLTELRTRKVALEQQK